MLQQISEVASFVEKSHGHMHCVASVIPGSFAPEGATHIIITRDGYRFIKLLKTVCYVAIDEDSDGKAIWEKWDIRNLTMYQAPYVRNISIGIH